MSSESFFWKGQPIPFRAGESIAAALEAAGIVSFGPNPAGGPTRYFCGIGSCQCCLVRIDGCVREACLTPATAGARVEEMGVADVEV
jgi:predicted molibdopterin-dependent oxidoreductase YjgC